MSFELMGVDEDGVVAFTGSDRQPALLEWLTVLSLGLAFLVGVATGGVYAARQSHPGVLLLSIPLALLFGWLAVGGALWWLRVRGRLATLASIRDLSERTGVGEADLIRAAEGARLMPVYRVNRVDLYDPAQFDAGSLLRSADSDKALLLPARNTASKSTLVSPAAPSDET